jgi:DNA-binding NtrC family response regulator
MEWIRPPVIVVLDDERVIADTLAQILRLHGCNSQAIYTAGAALQALDDRPDLLITDVALDPDSINGIDVAMYYRQECAACKVLLISGHAATLDLLANPQVRRQGFPLLQKPVHPNELLFAVCEILNTLCKKQEEQASNVS